jgi:pyrroline-5-carboxylate reductase
LINQASFTPALTHDLCIIGGGNMAEAIVRGLLRARQIPADRIIIADISPQRREFFSSQLKVQAVAENSAAAQSAKLLLLSVKPQQMAPALQSIAPTIQPDALIVSIAAGTTTAFIERSLAGKSIRVVRAMPNTPMLVGEGITAICPGSLATAADLAQARRIFEAASVVIETTEDKMDAVTAVSGSGPAYFFYLVEQLIHAAVDLGIPQQEARLLAAKTAAGAARMLLESPDSPAELRRKVTSPGGTTQAAIEHLDQSAWPAAMIAAVKAAAARSRQLSQK